MFQVLSLDLGVIWMCLVKWQQDVSFWYLWPWTRFCDYTGISQSNLVSFLNYELVFAFLRLCILLNHFLHLLQWGFRTELRTWSKCPAKRVYSLAPLINTLQSRCMDIGGGYSSIIQTNPLFVVIPSRRKTGLDSWVTCLQSGFRWTVDMIYRLVGRQTSLEFVMYSLQ